jgi:hypothetical protein
MDPEAIAIIASSAVNLLVLYLRGAAEELAKKAGEGLGKVSATAAGNKVKELYNAVRTRFAGKEAAIEALEDLEKTPDDPDTQAAVRAQLRKLMQFDDAFTKQLAILLKDAADVGVDTIFNTNIYGNVQKLTVMRDVYGDITIECGVI